MNHRLKELDQLIESYQSKDILPMNESVEKVISRYAHFKEFEKEFGKLTREKNVFVPNGLSRWCFIEKLFERKGKKYIDPLIPYPSKKNINSDLYHYLKKKKIGEKDIKEINYKMNKSARKIVKFLSKYKKKDKYKVSVEKNENEYYIKYGEKVKMKINKKHYEKLKKIYIGKEELFKKLLFNLLMRYNTLGAFGYQGAIPPSMWKFLKDNMNVTHECFASPLNCTLKSYSSGFYDIDYYFGSKGSFYDLDFKEGSFEANPPFIEEHMFLMAKHILNMFDSAIGPMSFTIFTSAWDDTPSHKLFMESRYLKHFIKFGAKEHIYIEGSQHKSKTQVRKAIAPSFVYILQNKKGYNKWNIDNKIQEFKDIFSGKI